MLEIVLILAAAAAGVTGAWSPCGFSMVETLAPQGYAGRLRTTAAACVTFAAGALVGGVVTFGGLALAGQALGAGGPAACFRSSRWRPPAAAPPTPRWRSGRRSCARCARSTPSRSPRAPSSWWPRWNH